MYLEGWDLWRYKQSCIERDGIYREISRVVLKRDGFYREISRVVLRGMGFIER